MSGAAAENYFGLSTQIPMKIVYVTSGSARKLSVGNTVIEFKRGVPKIFAFKDKTMATLCLALKSIGNGKITDEQKILLRDFLKEFSGKHDISRDLRLMPKWAQKLLNDLMKEPPMPQSIGGSCFIYVGNLFTDETDGTTFIVPIIFAVAGISADISIGNL